MTAPVPGEGDAAIKKTKKDSDSSGNVRVVSRIRPMAKYELEKGCEPVVSKVPNFDDNDGPESIQINEGDKRWFELDAVLDQECTQQEVYEKSGAYKAISEDLFSGFNCTILAYGQTGAGKVSITRFSFLHVAGYMYWKTMNEKETVSPGSDISFVVSSLSNFNLLPGIDIYHGNSSKERGRNWGI